MRGEPLSLQHGLPFSATDLMAVAGIRYMSGRGESGLRR
jgi:hypothetical protein